MGLGTHGKPPNPCSSNSIASRVQCGGMGKGQSDLRSSEIFGASRKSYRGITRRFVFVIDMHDQHLLNSTANYIYNFLFAFTYESQLIGPLRDLRC